MAQAPAPEREMNLRNQNPDHVFALHDNVYFQPLNMVGRQLPAEAALYDDEDDFDVDEMDIPEETAAAIIASYDAEEI